MKTLLLIGVGLDSPDTLQRIYECGIKVVFVQLPTRFEAEDGRYAQTVILTDFQTDEFFCLANRLHEHWRFSAALSLTEVGVEMAARLNAHWGIAWTSVGVVQLLKNKYAMRQHLNRWGFSTVPCTMCDSADDLLHFANRVGLPVMLKPVDGGGSEGIYKISELQKIPRAMAALQNLGAKAFAEAWIAGREYSVESFSFSSRHYIIAITEKQVNEQFIEIGHIVPALLENGCRDAIHQYVLRFLTLLGVTDGPCHTELKVNNGEIKIIESHNRIGGDSIGVLVRHVYGVDLIKLAACWACGLAAPSIVIGNARGYAATRFFLFPTGLIQSIHGAAEIEAQAGKRLLAFKLNYHAGDFVPQEASNSVRAGYLIITGTEHEETWDTAELLASYIYSE